ncbi:MAG: hypothetical protein NUV57_02370 [archaeon]|nr:hypothetical protein [archaeon]
MFTNMSLTGQILDGILSLYIILGSPTWGYILLRIGWPNIRSLEPEYKSGWSIIFGLIFSVLVLASSAIVFFLEITRMAFSEILLINSIIFMSAGIILFTLKRKFLGTKKVNVSVPKRIISANVVAKKAIEKLPEQSFVKTYTDRQHRISELKNKLENINPLQQGQQIQKVKAEQPKAEPIMKKNIQKPLRDMKPAITYKPETVSPEKTKRLDQIIQNLEKRQSEKDNQNIVTRQEMEEQTENRKKYVTENLRETISFETKPKEDNSKEDKSEEDKLEKEMPRSAKLLKELLKETEATK